MAVSSDVDHCFNPESVQTKNYKIGIHYFSTKHTAVRSKNTGWLGARIMNYSTIKNPTQHIGLVQNKTTLNYKLIEDFFLFIFSSPCQRQCEFLPSLGVRRLLTFHILIFSSETPQPNELKLGRKHLAWTVKRKITLAIISLRN